MLNNSDRSGVKAAARNVALSELPDVHLAGKKLLEGDLSLISGVKVLVEAIVGGAEITVDELFSLQEGSIVTLDQLCDMPISVRLNGQTIATGTLMVVGDNFGIRVSAVRSIVGKNET